MKTYQVKNTVKATPMNLGKYNKLRGWGMPTTEDPDREGYLVENSKGGDKNHPDFDNYITWVSKTTFEQSHILEEGEPQITFNTLTNDVIKNSLTFADKLDSIFDNCNKMEREVGMVVTGILGTATALSVSLLEKERELSSLRNMLPSDSEIDVVTLTTYGEHYDKPALATNLSWPVAQQLLNKGFTVLRSGWNGKGMFVSYSDGIDALPAEKFWVEANKEAALKNGGTLPVSSYFTLFTAQKTIQMGWVPSIGDLTAHDWVVLMK